MSLRGEMHWNYQGKGCSREDRVRIKELNADIKLLEIVAIELGIIFPK
jgi:hypothetical protein